MLQIGYKLSYEREIIPELTKAAKRKTAA